jgi:hypothetical protein
MEPQQVLVRLVQPVVALSPAKAAELFKLGIAEEARESIMPTSPEPEALIRFLVPAMALRSYFNRGEIAGCSEKDAAFYVKKGMAERITREERDAALKAARDRQAKEAEEELVLVRFLRSWAVHGAYYNAGEIAGFRGQGKGGQARYVLDARTKEDQPFVQQLTPEEITELNARIAADAKAAASRGTEKLVLIRFLVSTVTHGCYYGAGETAGFSKEAAKEILARRSLVGDPVAELVKGPAPKDGELADVQVPEGEEVIGLTDRDPDGVAALEQARADQGNQEKGFEAPPKHRMVEAPPRKK